MKIINIIIGVLLTSLLGTGIFKSQLNSSISSASSKQLKSSLELVKAYGRVNAVSSDYIQLILFGQEISTGKDWKNKLKTVPKVYDKLDPNEQQIWGDSLVKTFYVYELNNQSEQFQNECAVANKLFKYEPNILLFDNNKLEWQHKVKRIEMIELIIISLILLLYTFQISKYSIKKDQSIDVVPQENNNDINP